MPLNMRRNSRNEIKTRLQGMENWPDMPPEQLPKERDEYTSEDFIQQYKTIRSENRIKRRCAVCTYNRVYLDSPFTCSGCRGRE